MDFKTLLIALPLLGLPAHAQVVPCAAGATGFPCGSQIDQVAIAPAPTELSIQARVAQAKIAIGKGLFEKLTVRVLEGATQLCEEQFQNVSVENGVLNLRIGREMSCDLGQVVTERSNLSLQLCPGGAQCLPPMAFGAVPSVLEAGVAARARKAHRVEVAAQAHFAPRLDADADVAKTGRVRQGYFEASALRNGTLSQSTLAWVPVKRPSARTMVLGARNAGTGELLPLDRLTVVAETIALTGSAEVRPSPGALGLQVTNGFWGLGLLAWATSRVDGTLSAGAEARGTQHARSAGPVSVGSDSTLATGARAGSLTVVAGPLTVGPATVTTDRLTVGGSATIQGLLVTSRDVRAGTALRTGELVMPAAASLRASGGVAGFAASGGVKSITQGNVVIAQLVGGNLEIAPPGGRIARVRIRTGIAGPTATFNDAVTLPSDLSCPFGKVRDQVSKACVDVDECATGEAACGANATCANQNPGYQCTCKPGFVGNGYICSTL